MSKDKLFKIKENSILSSFSILASGSIIAQLLGILVSPLSTRLFSPEDFGIYTLITTAVSIFGPIICGKYDMGIVVSQTKKETYNLITLCMFICVIFSILIGVLYSSLILVNQLEGFLLFLSMVSIIILLINYGLNNILLSHNNKNKYYKLISAVTVFKSGVQNSLLIIMGLLNFGVVGMIFSQIGSTFAGLKMQAKELLKDRKEFRYVTFKDIKNEAKRNIKQPIFNASAALITTFAYSSINLFISHSYSTSQLGLYSLSYRTLGIPFTVISANMARIFFEIASKEQQQMNKFHASYKKMFFLLCITVLPLIFLIAWFAPWIFKIAFGSEWVDAGRFVRLLAPMFGVRLIAESLTTTFIIKNKQHFELIFQGILLALEILLYVLVIYNTWSIDLFLIFISIIYLIVYSIMIFIMYILSKKET